MLNARSEDIFQALEAAYQDGFDIANMSLGGGYHGVQDLDMAAVDHLDRANMVVAVAAGNSGPGNFTVESPGAAARALTAGASTVPHYIGTAVTVNGHTYGAAPGEFNLVAADLTAPLAVVTDGTSVSRACSALPPGSLAGQIALIVRGSCSFSTKIRDCQQAGALAVLVINNAVGDPIIMAQDGTPDQPTIPAYMLSLNDGIAILGANGMPTTISATLGYFQSANADIMASFSGVGPTLVDFRIKPDVVAPGVSVLSSIPISFCGGAPCFAFFQGTSMATPHLAGSAAVVKWLHPDWSSAEIRSAIINMANDGVLRNFANGAPEHDVDVVGAGREDLLAAANATVSLDPVSISYGGVPYGSGQTQPVTVTLNNLGTSAATYSLATSGGDSSVAFAVIPTTLTVMPGQSANIKVIMSAVKDAAIGFHQGKLTITSGGMEVAHAKILTTIK